MQKLISPVTASQGGETIRYFVKDSEIFDVLHESHLSIGHKGRDAMDNLIKQRYVNVTQADILMYLSFCRPCHEKKKTKRKGIVTNPILHDELNSRCQVGLIDYQSAPSYDFKWVMVYQDHLTSSAF